MSRAEQSRCSLPAKHATPNVPRAGTVTVIPPAKRALRAGKGVDVKSFPGSQKCHPLVLRYDVVSRLAGAWSDWVCQFVVICMQAGRQAGSSVARQLYHLHGLCLVGRSVSIFFSEVGSMWDGCVHGNEYMYLVGHAAAACVTTPYHTPPPSHWNSTSPSWSRVAPRHDWLANYQIGFSDGESLFPYSDLHISSGHSDSTIPCTFLSPLLPQRAECVPHSSRISPSLESLPPPREGMPAVGRDTHTTRTHALGHVSRAEAVATR